LFSPKETTEKVILQCGTGAPDLDFAKKFADAVHKVHTGKLLAYNFSPSFNRKKNLDDATITKFQRDRADRHNQRRAVPLRRGCAGAA